MAVFPHVDNQRLLIYIIYITIGYIIMYNILYGIIILYNANKINEVNKQPQPHRWSDWNEFTL